MKIQKKRNPLEIGRRSDFWKFQTPRLHISDSKQIKSVDTFPLSSPPATNLLPRHSNTVSVSVRRWYFTTTTVVTSQTVPPSTAFTAVCTRMYRRLGALVYPCRKSRSRPRRTGRGPVDRKGTSYYTYGGISAIRHGTPPRPTPVTLSSCYPHCEITRRRHLSANATGAVQWKRQQ